MFEQIFDGVRKASESSFKLQQDALRSWTQGWFNAPGVAPGVSNEFSATFQKRWVDLTIDLLNKHRASIDAAYKSGIQLIERAFRATDARSPEDYRDMVEDVWRQVFDTIRTQSESQMREFQKWADESFDTQKRPKAA
jgi:hypothetical protein